MYIPNKFSNHFLKDDFLYIAYSGKIKEAESSSSIFLHSKCSGFDEIVWGKEIIRILKGVQLYSSFDISGIVQQLKEKRKWLIREYPNEFGKDKWEFDVDIYFDDDKMG